MLLNYHGRIMWDQITWDDMGILSGLPSTLNPKNNAEDRV